MVELKSFTIHFGSMINSLSPLAPTTDFIGCSLPSSEPSSGLAISMSLFVEDGEKADGLLSSLDSLGLYDLMGILPRNPPRHKQITGYLTH